MSACAKKRKPVIRPIFIVERVKRTSSTNENRLRCPAVVVPRRAHDIARSVVLRNEPEHDGKWALIDESRFSTDQQPERVETFDKSPHVLIVITVEIRSLAPSCSDVWLY